MASNKSKNIILGIIVIAVWGAIAFKIISYFNKSSVVDLPTTNVFKTAGIKVKKERFNLDASYGDPFLKEIKEKVIPSNQTSQHSGNRVEFQPLKPNTVWPEIKYSGIVETSNKEKRIGLLKVDKRDYLVSNGDSIPKVKIIAIYKDSLRLKFSNEEKTYTLQKKN
jgi:hypothetical protein